MIIMFKVVPVTTTSRRWSLSCSFPIVQPKGEGGFQEFQQRWWWRQLVKQVYAYPQSSLPHQIGVDGVRLLSCWIHQFGVVMCCD